MWEKLLNQREKKVKNKLINDNNNNNNNKHKNEIKRERKKRLKNESNTIKDILALLNNEN